MVLNSEQGRTALDYYIRLSREAGHPKTAAIDQAEVIQNMVTGKAAHVMMVISAWSQMDDPTKSAVVDKVEFAPTPHAPGFASTPGLGHWLGGVARNVPDDRKRGRRRVPALVPDQAGADGDAQWPAASRSAPPSTASRSPASAGSAG